MWQERHPSYVFASDINRGFDVFYVWSMGPGYVARGTIHGGHPGTYAGAGVTLTEFTTDCAYSPRTNGVDAWIAEIPASVADGEHAIKAKPISTAGNEYDLD